MDLNPMTKLEAVNLLLAMIGDQPVDSLDTTQAPSAQTAIDEVDRTTRNVQTEGFNFNTDYEYKLTRDENNEIQVPTGVLSIEASDRTQNIVWRGSRLYDKKKQTYKFDNDLDVNVVWGFEFKELPEHIRQYVAIKAGRNFQNRQVGSEVLYKLSQNDELEARARMMREEERNMDNNILSSPVLRMGGIR